jgi:hypothetical protein
MIFFGKPALPDHARFPEILVHVEMDKSVA